MFNLKLNSMNEVNSHIRYLSFGTKKKKSKTSEPVPDCAICHEPLTADTLVTPGCNHTFHRNCICTWLRSNRSCPLCRNNFTPAQINGMCPHNERTENEPRSVRRRLMYDAVYGPDPSSTGTVVTWN